MPGDDPRDLVAPSLGNVPGWVGSFGERSGFRVRGLEWFRASVLPDIDKLKPYIKQMEALRLTRPAWTSNEVKWDQTFSLTQVYAARRKEALKFGKAAKVLLLCEVVAQAEKGIPPSVLYSRMRIEPALFGIADFDSELLRDACGQKENLLGLLRSSCNQTTAKVFEDMASGSAVSYRLAWMTRETLKFHVPRVPWGELIILPDRWARPKFSVSNWEEIEGASVPVGAPDVFKATMQPIAGRPGPAAPISPPLDQEAEP